MAGRYWYQPGNAVPAKHSNLKTLYNKHDSQGITIIGIIAALLVCLFDAAKSVQKDCTVVRPLAFGFTHAATFWHIIPRDFSPGRTYACEWLLSMHRCRAHDLLRTWAPVPIPQCRAKERASPIVFRTRAAPCCVGFETSSGQTSCVSWTGMNFLEFYN